MKKNIFLTTVLLSVFSLIVSAGPKTLVVDYGIENISTLIKNADINREYLAVKKEKQKSRNQNREIQLLPSFDFKPIPVEKEDGFFAIKTKNLTLKFPTTNDRRIKIHKSYKNTKSAEAIKTDFSFEVSLPNFDEQFVTGVNAKLSRDNSVVYKNYQKGVDVVVQSFENSMRILTVLKDKNAPSEYVYEVDMPAGGELIHNEEHGSVIILDSDGNFIGGFAPTWAIDNDGNEIPTHWEVSGNHLIQVVDHIDSNPSYPVVADPYLGFDMISSASWTNPTVGWILKVTPTGWARSSGGGYIPGVYGWDELYDKYKDLGLNTNLGGMKDQYICHQQIAFLKSTYNLDEWRPDVSYPATLAALCNPEP